MGLLFVFTLNLIIDHVNTNKLRLSTKVVSYRKHVIFNITIVGLNES